jgi:hypothetical protein
MCQSSQDLIIRVVTNRDGAYRHFGAGTRFNCNVWGFCRYRTGCTGGQDDLRLKIPKGLNGNPICSCTVFFFSYSRADAWEGDDDVSKILGIDEHNDWEEIL